MNFTTAPTRALALSTAAVLLLSGCGDSTDETVEPVDTTQAPPADDGAAESTEDDNATDDNATDDDDATEDDATEDDDASEDGDENGTDPGSPDGTGPHAGLLAAIDLAEAELDAIAFEIDDEDDGNWEITVAAGDEEIEVLTSGDGTEVLSTENEGSLGSDDRAGLDAASVSISEAIETADGEHSGSIDDVELDDDDGTFAWEVTFTDDVEVYVDVASGQVLKVETD